MSNLPDIAANNFRQALAERVGARLMEQGKWNVNVPEGLQFTGDKQTSPLKTGGSAQEKSTERL